MLRHRDFLSACVVVVVLYAGVPRLVWGQNPFGENDPAQPAAAAPQPAVGPAAESPASEEANPVIRGILESNPTAPLELMWAVELTMNLGRVDQVQKYMQSLVDANPDAAQLLAIEQRWGAVLFLRLSQQSRYGRPVREQAQQLLSATHRVLHSPARIQGLVERLEHPSAVTRQVAIHDLQQLGTSAVPPLLAVLGDANRTDSHVVIRAALVGLGGTAAKPLVAALQCPDAAVRWQVVEVLGRLKRSNVIDFLLGMMFDPQEDPRVERAAIEAVQRLVGSRPTQHEVERFLYQRSRDFLHGQPVEADDLEGRVAFWEWNESAQTVLAAAHSAEQASLITARRLASDLYLLDPENVDYRRLFVVSVLESEKRLAGLDQPLERGSVDCQTLAGLGVEALEDGLLFAVRQKHLAAATGAVELLGDVGDEKLVHSSDGRPRPLVKYLRHPDLRLRMACLDTIMKLDPQRSYPGCSYVTEMLGFVAGSQGFPRVLVGDPRAARAQSIVGLLNQLGYQADTATNGRDLFRLAVSNPDYQFVLIGDAVGRPDLRELVQMLRRDPRSSSLPIGIMARTERMARAQQIAALDGRTMAFALGALDVRLPSYELTISVRGVDQPGFEAMLNVIRRDPRNDGLIMHVATRGAALADARVVADADLRVEARSGGPPPIVDGVHYDLTLDGDGADVPPLTQLVTFLREERETKDLAYQILAQGPALIEAQQIAAADATIQVAVRPTKRARISRLVQQMLAGFDTEVVPFSVRLEHSRQALRWLDKLIADKDKYRFYNLLRTEPAVARALNTPSLSLHSAQVLGRLGSPRGQLALVDLASEHNRPLVQRQAAAAAFGIAVSRRGVLLTSRNIERQYDRYNQSARLDKATQELLGAILDVIEQPAQTVQESSGS